MAGSPRTRKGLRRTTTCCGRRWRAICSAPRPRTRRSSTAMAAYVREQAAALRRQDSARAAGRRHRVRRSAGSGRTNGRGREAGEPMSRAPEFSRRVKLARIGAEPYRQRISASEDERAALGPAFRPGFAGPARGHSRTDPRRDPRGRADNSAARRFRGGLRATLHRHAGPDRRRARRAVRAALRPARSRRDRCQSSSARTSRSSRWSATRSISARRLRRNSRWRCRRFRAAPKSASKAESDAAAPPGPFAGLSRLVDRDGGET